MNIFLEIGLFLTIFGCIQAAPLSSYAKFSSISMTSGGEQGCVVSGNSLYINGLKEKDLSGNELAEFNRYLDNVKAFRERVRQLLNLHRNTSLQTTPQSSGINYDPSVSGPNFTLPDPPEKPSFCQYNITTQYVFDGCKVQNNKLYIGNQYVRDLNAEEQDQLKKFDEQMTKYQDQMSENMQRQIERVFGKSFSRFFGSNSFSKIETRGEQGNEVAETSTTEAAPIEIPETPKFCVKIQ